MANTLLVMAAGMGSRYGGDKQVDQIGPGGQILMEYSIYDALEAGFDKVVFVIRKRMEASFRAAYGDVIAKKVPVCYAFQEYDTLPGGFLPPADRVKPYGTVHAVTCAKAFLDGPFAVINADDYYGKDAFRVMAESLSRLSGKAASMVSYALKNTVSENGHVTRGVCSLSPEGKLVKVTETYQIRVFPDGTIRDLNTSEEGTVLDPDARVSMNFWGFTPWFVREAEKALERFLQADGDPLKKEFVLPVLVDTLMRSSDFSVDVLSSEAVWFGVTYREDKPLVAAELKKLHELGAYPEKMF